MMKIVVLDAATMGADMDFSPLYALGEVRYINTRVKRRSPLALQMPMFAWNIISSAIAVMR